jgi:hypothetical protein
VRGGGSLAAFDPATPDFESAVRESFDRLTLMRTIGAVLERVAPDHVFMAAAILSARWSMSLAVTPG